jgi:protein-L-isoaspartate O-methyltransferase
MTVVVSRHQRERAFWDEHVQPLDHCLRAFHTGPDANTALLLDALEPLHGMRVLDFGCGDGLTSSWLAARGAHVVGVDISEASILRAKELMQALGLQATFLAGSSVLRELPRAAFDRIAGRFVLHHVDCSAIAPVLATLLAANGCAAFVETCASNPLLRLARTYLVGRFGIPRYGTLDERPLQADDFETLRTVFGALRREVAEMQFLTVFDRQVLHYRHPKTSRLLKAADSFLLERLGLKSLSYHQVLILG